MALHASEVTLFQVLWDQNNYLVPPYQRDYAWDKEQRSALWTDILRTADSGDEYFLGSLVFVKTENPQNLDVLDGQQRFATLLLLLAALRDVMKAENPGSGNLAQIVAALKHVDMSGSFGNQEVVHMRLNDRDSAYFDQVVSSGDTRNDRHASHRLIANTYKYYTDKLREESAKRGGIDVLWESLKTAFTKKLFVVRIEVDDYANAQMVFEALNSAGLDLTQADLVKNYLLRELKTGDFEPGYRSWMRMVDNLGGDDVTTYVRAYWNSAHDFSRTADLYKQLKQAVKRLPDPRKEHEQEVTLFLSQLETESGVWAALRNPEGSDTLSRRPDLARDLSDLRDLGAVMVYVPLLSAWKVVDGDLRAFGSFARKVLDFYVRYTVIGRRAGNEVEESFSDYARDLRRGQLTLDGLVDRLRDLDDGDEVFHDRFASVAIKRQLTARILLARINDSVNPENSLTRTMVEGGKVHLEHIIPQQPNVLWAQFLDRNGVVHDEVVNRLGNQTLLLGAKNIAASNRWFAEKQEMYRGGGSPEPVNAMLLDYQEFGLPELEARQLWLADRAKGIWTLRDH